MRILDWLFNRSASCAELREECSLYERQANALREELEDARAGCEELAEECAGMTALGEDLLAIVDHLTRERDALARELWMERRRNEDLRKPRVFDVSKARDSIHRVIREGGPVS
jgi:chromosome segregation ATPase